MVRSFAGGFGAVMTSGTTACNDTGMVHRGWRPACSAVASVTG
ncbi:MAG: hypothetical protein Q7T79_02470 [bacterium]|nr:hypothetical protein [bacterium]